MRYYSKFHQHQVSSDYSPSYSSISNSYEPSSLSADHISSYTTDQLDGHRFFLVLFDAYSIPIHPCSDKGPSYQEVGLSNLLWQDITAPHLLATSYLMYQWHIPSLTFQLASKSHPLPRLEVRITIIRIILL